MQLSNSNAKGKTSPSPKAPSKSQGDITPRKRTRRNLILNLSEISPPSRLRPKPKARTDRRPRSPPLSREEHVSRSSRIPDAASAASAPTPSVCGCIGNGFGGVKLFLQKSRNRPLRRALAWRQCAACGAGLPLAAAEAPRFPWKGRDGTGPAAPCALRAGAGEANANSSECPSFRGSDKEKTVTTLAARFVRTQTQVERSRFGAELGHEAPIEIDGSRPPAGRERRHIPLRWLVGVALAGLCGLALVGAALYLDLDSESTFAEAPEYAVATHREGAPEDGVNPGKGDRLVRPIDIVAAKQTFKAPTTIKIGDKEVVKARPFTILSTTLTVTPTGFADAVPPFDPLKATSGSAEKADAPPDPGPVQ